MSRTKEFQLETEATPDIPDKQRNPIKPNPNQPTPPKHLPALREQQTRMLNKYDGFTSGYSDQKRRWEIYFFDDKSLHLLSTGYTMKFARREMETYIRIYLQGRILEPRKGVEE